MDYFNKQKKSNGKKYFLFLHRSKLFVSTFEVIILADYSGASLKRESLHIMILHH